MTGCGPQCVQVAQQSCTAGPWGLRPASHPQPSPGTGSRPHGQASPVWGVRGASLLSAPCRSRTHGSCPCSSREISSGLKTRNPAVKVAKKNTALAWLGMRLRAQTPWFPGIKGQGLLAQAEPLKKASEAEDLGMAVLSGSVQLLRLDREGCLDSTHPHLPQGQDS